MRLSWIATAVAAATLSLAVSPAFALSATPTPTPVDTTSHGNSTPRLDLGVDTSQAGGTSESVKAFVANLALETQASMRGGCQTVLKYPAGYQPETVRFCTLLNE